MVACNVYAHTQAPQHSMLSIYPVGQRGSKVTASWYTTVGTAAGTKCCLLCGLCSEDKYMISGNIGTVY